MEPPDRQSAAASASRPIWATRLRRFGPLAAILLALGLALAFDLHRILSFDMLRTHRDSLRTLVEAHLLLAALGYGLLYAVAIALSLPGAAVLSVSAGFLFGMAVGVPVVVAGATAGAVLIFLAARSAIGDALRRRAGPWLHRLEAGFHENGFSYLLTLRLIPLFPFWLINLVPAILGMRLAPYALATLLGILPGSVVFVGIGNGLGATLDRGEEPALDLLLRPDLLVPLLGLAALSLLPVLWRHWRRRRGAPS